MLVFVVQLCFGPVGPPASPALPQSELDLLLPVFPNPFHLLYFWDLIYSIDDWKCVKLQEEKVYRCDWNITVA